MNPSPRDGGSAPGHADADFLGENPVAVGEAEAQSSPDGRPCCHPRKHQSLETPTEGKTAAVAPASLCTGTMISHTCQTAAEDSTCCSRNGSESSASAGKTGSTSTTDSHDAGARSVTQPVTPLQEPLGITCSIIRHMSSASASNALSESTKPAEAPPRPRLHSSVPKLWYFNARGRAEIIRLIFAQAAVEYEDLRFREPPYAMEDFYQFKQTHDLPFGQVPVLEIDGMLLAQSQAIVRYLSRKYNLMADDEVENVRADMIFCGTEDLKQKFTTLLFSTGGGNLEETETLVERFVKDTCVRWGTYFEKLLKKNGGVWMVGDHVTYADLAVYDVISTITWRLPTCFSQNVLLLDHSRRVEALPGIATYLRRRPDVPI